MNTNFGKRGGNSEADLLARIEALELALRQIPSRFHIPRQFFPVKLTARELTTEEGRDFVWRYSWQEVGFQLNEDDWLEEKLLLATGGRAGPWALGEVNTGYAWNVNELNNANGTVTGSGWYADTDGHFPITTEAAFGPDNHEHDIRAEGIEPIYESNEPIVFVRQYMLDDGHVAFLFCGWNVPVFNPSGGA